MSVSQQHLRDLIDQLEQDLTKLKRALASSSNVNSRQATKKKAKSLYGIFPHSKTTMADFRAARKSWSRRLDDFK
jgi:hypothetical protein